MMEDFAKINVLDVVELNSSAILEMRQQNFDKAITTLQTAVTALEGMYRSGSTISCHHQPTKKRRRLSSDESVSSTLSSSSSVVETGECAIGIVNSVEAMDTLAHAALCATSGVSNDNILLFYNRAFTFLNYRDIDFDLNENKSSLSGMMLYNLGLAHHMMAIHSGRTADIYQALRFYRLAHLSLEQVKNVVSMDVHILLLMGLINNMGHIHATLFHREQIDSCIRWLRKAVVSKQGAILEEVDRDFFFGNLKVLPEELCKTAPSA